MNLYFPILPGYEGKTLKVHVLGLRNGFGGVKADVYLASGDTLPCSAELTLK